jgi:hypothetical protein
LFISEQQLRPLFIFGNHTFGVSQWVGGSTSLQYQLYSSGAENETR